MNPMNQFRSGEWADVPSAQVIVPEAPNTKLSVVLPFLEKEMDDVVRLLLRSFELSGQIPRNLFLVPFKGLKYDDVLRTAQAAFTSVGTIHDAEGVASDWNQRERMRSAAGPNSLFRQVAWFFYLNKRYGSWLWLEPDCWPETPRWLYDLEREHFEVGRPFTGVKMRIGDSKDYMNGVAIYPWNAIQYAPLLVQSAMWKQHPTVEIGFDVAGGDDVLRHAHITRLIQLTNHLAQGNVSIRSETVLAHGRNNLSGEHQPHKNEVLQPADHAGTTVDGLSAQKPFLGAYGVARDAQTEVLADSSFSAFPSHESESTPKPVLPPAGRIQESNYEREIKEYREGKLAGEPAFDKPVSDYGAISERIQFLVQELVISWDDKPHRKVQIVKELRKAKLVPKHFR